MIATVDAVLSHELAEESGSRSDVVFCRRAAHLKRGLLPVLDWLGTHKDFPLTIDTIRSAFELPWLCTLSKHRLVLLVHHRSGESRAFCSAHEMPAPLLVPLQHYVAELESVTVVGGQQVSGEPEQERQHRFVTMYFASGFTRLRCGIAHWVH
jgi:hypothetical protein